MKKSWLIVLAFFTMGLSILLLIRYPNDISIGEKLFYGIGLNPWSNGNSGFNYVSIFIFLLIFTSIWASSRYFNSKYLGRIIFLSFALVIVLPNFLVIQYQTFIAEGIYSLDYNDKNSRCDFKTDNNDMFSGVCELEFTNYSKERITFYLSLRETENQYITSSLVNLNVIEQYPLTILPKETKVFSIPFSKDISNSKNGISQGSGYGGIPIIISDGVNQREL